MAVVREASAARPVQEGKPTDDPTTIANAVLASAAPNKSSVHEPSAIDRLMASRVRLRGALLAIAHPLPPKPLFSEGIGGVGAELLNRLRSVPVAALIIQAAEGWWREHPLNKAGTIAAKASMTLIKPYAKRRPLHTVGIAAIVTVLVLVLKPWRFFLRPKAILSAVGGIALHALKTKSPRDLLSKVFSPRSSA